MAYTFVLELVYVITIHTFMLTYTLLKFYFVFYTFIDIVYTSGVRNYTYTVVIRYWNIVLHTWACMYTCVITIYIGIQY